MYVCMYELINYMNVLLTVFRNDSMAFCSHLRSKFYLWEVFLITIRAATNDYFDNRLVC